MKQLLLGAAIGILGMASASAADLPVKSRVVTPIAPSWTGFYVGLHAGWAWNSQSATTTSITTDLLGLPTSHSLSRNGPLYGAQVGYNVQVANWVFGIEGDFSGVHASATSSADIFPNVAPLLPRGTATLTSDIEWLASIRGRLGLTWGSGLVYVTGGIASAGVTHQGTYNVVTPFVAAASVSAKESKSGWVLGGGYEGMVTGNWTLRAEYLYYSFGDHTASTNLAHNIGVPPFPATLNYAWSDLNIQTLRLGFNYKL
ncbi:MAG TPA: outer membrane beta-barrel protein [Vicinamibacterales bacterium]